MNAAVIATYDEADTIGHLVTDLHASGLIDWVIVADESPLPATEKAARRAGAHVIRTTGGIGPSLVDAWYCAIDEGASTIVQMDAGGSHLVSDLSVLLGSPLSDITIGSRFVPGATYTGRPWRRTASLAYGWLWNAQYRAGVRDWTSGFRVFKAKVAADLGQCTYHARMHGWQAEVLARGVEHGYTISEVPIHYHAGDTSLNWSHTKEALKLRVALR